MQIIPTFYFKGNCREALHLYEKAFDGEIRCIITYGEANDPAYSSLDERQKQYIYHAELVVNNQRLMMSDYTDSDSQTSKSNFLTVIYDTEEEVRKAYDLMKDGSKTIYQLEATSFSSCRVLFVDRFGNQWGIMTE